MLEIDPEFKYLIPELTIEEYDILAVSIKTEGCREAITVWNGVIVDGHNRYQICTLHDIPFQTVEKQFKDRDEAKKWVILNQLGRRNLSDFDRGRLALTLAENFRKKAAENQVATQYKTGGIPVLQDLSKQEGNNTEDIDSLGMPKLAGPKAPINTREEVAKLCGLSHGTIDKIKFIEEKATPELKHATSREIVSINTAAAIAELEHEEQKEVLQLSAKEIVDKAKDIREKQKRIIEEVYFSAEAGTASEEGKFFKKEEKEIRRKIRKVASDLAQRSKEEPIESLSGSLLQAITDLTGIRNQISPHTETHTGNN